MQDSHRLFLGLDSSASPASGRSVLGSALIHGAIVALLLSLGGQAVVSSPAVHRQYIYMDIAPPPAERPRVARLAQQPRIPKPADIPKSELARVARPAKLYAPPRETLPQKSVTIPAAPQLLADATPLHADLLPAAKPIPEPIKTGLFQPTAAVTVTNPKLAVEIGNFLGATATRGGLTNHQIASAGGFGGVQTADRVGSPGGSVKSAGFGQSLAAKPASASQPRPAEAGFAAPVVAQAAAPTKASDEPPVSVAAILDKPKPAYTEEARSLKVEGEVLVEVLFSANGKARVLRVVRGLGHGLDESAVRAAEGIRFRPAMRGGAPVDSVAVAHIEFQLAY